MLYPTVFLTLLPTHMGLTMRSPFPIWTRTEYPSLPPGADPHISSVWSSGHLVLGVQPWEGHEELQEEGQ